MENTTTIPYTKEEINAAEKDIRKEIDDYNKWFDKEMAWLEAERQRYLKLKHDKMCQLYDKYENMMPYLMNALMGKE